MLKPDLLIKFPKNANGKRFSDFYNEVDRFFHTMMMGSRILPASL